MKRVFDVALALLLAVPSMLVMAAVAAAVKVTSPGPVFHYSKRVGRGKKTFRMIKVRTMKIKTPQVATHLMSDPSQFLTPIGSFLRKTSLDELPQLWNILKGDMSFVGPRPALFNQNDLVALREEKGVNDLVPGVTGWAQVNGRDELAIPEKVALEEHYLKNMSLLLDIKILFMTVFRVIATHGVKH
ncbi:MAG: sugar transferase [Nitrospinae bacterium]|nr:sugar transferase [Nitrospinota bacterium]